MRWRWHISSVLSATAAWSALLGFLATEVRAEAETGQIGVEYIAPKDGRYQSLHDLLKERRALEQLQRLFSPLRLPSYLTLQASDCDGIANAWYERGRVTICYELLDVIRRTVPQYKTRAGVTQADAIVGQFLYIAGHEVGHAVFDLLSVPIFGNEEDAADQFATYFMLRSGKDQARRLIFGAAYYYNKHFQKASVTLRLEAFSDAHSKPQQRFFNLLCLSYGANSVMFAEVVDNVYLPEIALQAVSVNTAG